MRHVLPVLGCCLCLVASGALAQDAAPLAPYVAPSSAAPLPDAPVTPADPPMGAVRARSDTASNMSPSDTQSPIAPALPEPQAPDNDVAALLHAARAAIAGSRTGEAQEALERAESRLLTRDVAPADSSTPASDPQIDGINAARQALAVGNAAAAIQAIDAALRQG